MQGSSALTRLQAMNQSPREALEAMVAGMAAGTILTFTALSLSHGLTGSKGEGKQSADLLSTLAGAGLGGILGLVVTRNGPRQRQLPIPVSHFQETAGSGDWKDWRPFKVVSKVKESEEITSFHLEPVEEFPLPSFQPGQFLPIRLTIPGQLQPVIRTYSLSDYPLDGRPATYRISIKRELPPKGQDVPPGLASNFLHDQVQEGSIVEARPPGGSFVLDLTLSTPSVLISNGVGITPMMAMLKASVQTNPRRKAWFFHGARDGALHAFRDEVASTANQHGSISVHYAYSRPRLQDQSTFHSEGYVDASLIRSYVQEDADYFICGSKPFLDGIRSGLIEKGIPSERIRFEMFSKVRQPGPSAQSPAGELASSVTFSRSNLTVQWDGHADTLLDFAEDNGLAPSFSCRAGVCGTCECRLLQGEVTYEVEPTAPVASGSVLICISRPKTDQITLDL